MAGCVKMVYCSHMLLGSELQDVSVGLKHGWLCDVWFFFYKSCVDSCLDYSISSCFQKFFCRIFSSGCIGKGSGLQEGGSTRCLLDPTLHVACAVSRCPASLPSLIPEDWITLLWVCCPGWVCLLKRWLLSVGRTQLKASCPFISTLTSSLDASGSAGPVWHFSTDPGDKCHQDICGGVCLDQSVKTKRWAACTVSVCTILCTTTGCVTVQGPPAPGLLSTLSFIGMLLLSVTSFPNWLVWGFCNLPEFRKRTSAGFFPSISQLLFLFCSSDPCWFLMDFAWTGPKSVVFNVWRWSIVSIWDMPGSCFSTSSLLFLP